MDNTPQTENTEPKTDAEQLTLAADLAGQVAQHPAAGQPLRDLAPLLVQLLESLAADVAQLKAEAYRAPCEGCGAAGEAHQQAQG